MKDFIQLSGCRWFFAVCVPVCFFLSTQSLRAETVSAQKSSLLPEVQLIVESLEGRLRPDAPEPEAPEEMKELGRRVLSQEASYRALDYSALPASEEGYLRALQLTEMSAALTAIYRYARYLRDVPYKLQHDLPVVQVPSDILSPGLTRKRADFEEELHQSIPPQASAQWVRDVFEWKRSLWLARLANYSQILASIDQVLIKLNKQKEQASLNHQKLMMDQNLQSLLAMKNELLNEEPLLAQERTTPIINEDKQPLYVLLNDIFHMIPKRELLCEEAFPDKERPCPVWDLMGWTLPQIQTLRQHLEQEHLLHQKLGQEGMDSFMDQQQALEEKQASFIPLNPLLEKIDTFPGGTKRYFDLIEEYQSMSDEDRLIRQLRNELAYEVLLPNLTEMVDLLRHTLIEIPNRKFTDYLQDSQMRHAVLSALPDSMATEMKLVDQQLMQKHTGTQALLIDIAKHTLLGIATYYSFLLNPTATVNTIVGVARIIATAGAGYLTFWKPAARRLDIAGQRVFSGLYSYEMLALRYSQFRTAVWYTVAYAFIPLRLAPHLGRYSKSLHRVFRSFLGGRPSAGYAVRVAYGEARKPVALLFHKLANGHVLVKRLASRTWDAWKELGTMAKYLAKGQLGNAASVVQINRKALTNAFSSGAVLIHTETATRGGKEKVLDLYRDPINTGIWLAGQRGFLRNFIFVTSSDAALGFYGLGAFHVVDGLIAIFGINFAMSWIGQNLTGDFNFGRGMSDAGYHTVVSPWKLQYVDKFYENTLGQSFRAMGPKTPLLSAVEVGSRFTVYTANNFAGSAAYSNVVYHLFDKADNARIIKKSLGWWLPRNGQEGIWTRLKNALERGFGE